MYNIELKIQICVWEVFQLEYNFIQRYLCDARAGLAPSIGQSLYIPYPSCGSFCACSGSRSLTSSSSLHLSGCHRPSDSRLVAASAAGKTSLTFRSLSRSILHLYQIQIADDRCSSLCLLWFSPGRCWIHPRCVSPEETDTYFVRSRFLFPIIIIMIIIWHVESPAPLYLPSGRNNR